MRVWNPGLGLWFLIPPPTFSPSVSVVLLANCLENPKACGALQPDTWGDCARSWRRWDFSQCMAPFLTPSSRPPTGALVNVSRFLLISTSPLLFLPLISVFSLFHSPVAIRSLDTIVPFLWADRPRATNYRHYMMHDWTKWRLNASWLRTAPVSSFLMTSQSLIQSSFFEDLHVYWLTIGNRLASIPYVDLDVWTDSLVDNNSPAIELTWMLL